jgi:hypothetical protein
MWYFVFNFNIILTIKTKEVQMKSLFGIVLSDKQKWMGGGALAGSALTLLVMNAKKIFNALTEALSPEEESTTTTKKKEKAAAV